MHTQNLDISKVWKQKCFFTIGSDVSLISILKLLAWIVRQQICVSKWHIYLSFSVLGEHRRTHISVSVIFMKTSRVTKNYCNSELALQNLQMTSKMLNCMCFQFFLQVCLWDKFWEEGWPENKNSICKMIWDLKYTILQWNIHVPV